MAVTRNSVVNKSVLFILLTPIWVLEAFPAGVEDHQSALEGAAAWEAHQLVWGGGLVALADHPRVWAAGPVALADHPQVRVVQAYEIYMKKTKL
jgi:hypothetical protein